jgi:hypothetical protein
MQCCSQCGEEKPLSEFSPSSYYKGRTTYRSTCKTCSAVRKRLWMQNNPSKARAMKKRAYQKRMVTDPGYNRRWKLHNRYGLSLEAYNDMLTQQEGVCAACGLPETERCRGGGVSPLSVDHDHETGQVRGLLCHACNVSLGRLKEDVQRFAALDRYIRRHKDVTEHLQRTP